ncbi:synaptopodin-2 isoform X2 [Melanotaenia boesemani]|uniref:synaptopodin-2 isoform X2 n=1 Tax=Melanotaenia boesemani TaxID=1250792 RepID=UPI001C045D2F|nr:synaptopodin-2 isoform X2 [Melanotaenia boesemani]
MGTGDYICVTLRGGAPWGFSLEEERGETYTPFLVSQVEEGGCAFLAGVRDGDEVVSINGEPCANLTLLQASALIDTSIECLQLLLKRYHFISPEDCESEDACYGEMASSGKTLETTTLHIFSPRNSSQTPGEVFVSVSPGRQLDFKEDDEVIQQCFSPGDMVELQVSLSEQTLDDVGCTSLGSAHGIEGELSNREAVQTVLTTTTSQCMPCPARQPLSQHGMVVSSSTMLGQVEVFLQQPAASGAGRGLNVGGPRVNESAGSQSEEEEGGGHCEGAPGSFTISFKIPSEEPTPGEEQDSDSDGDQDKPNRHRARHARLRRNESLSEKQVKEAKSKCKRIALLLTAAPPNPNNRGVLMFKKHRQRAKKYTLVSYGTGEDEPEYSNSEDEDNKDKKKETQVGEFTFAASINSESDKLLLTDDPSSKGVLTSNLEKDLVEIERNLSNQAEMEGKGAAMFAQRRQRMDEISAEHEELRRQGLPVEGVKATEKKIMERSYMQSTMEGHAYMDVNMHQQNQQQYQQYQEQQYYGQQQNYQQQQQYQQYQQQQYEQSHFQQQQMYQQQQEYHQEQQQMQHYSTNINGMVQHQANEIQSSFSNRTTKPFTAENIVATPYSSALSGTNQEAVGQGEQIASRDERISTPAIRTGILLDSKKRNTGKPMFTFKEAPKVSPNPALLNLLNRSDKKLGFESGPEEDYLSLGAEACNFLQSQRLKPKIPPPVAPKPVINPNSPPWSPQIEAANQDMPQCAENSLSTPAVAPAAQTAPAPELEPSPAPASEPSPPPAPHETAVNTNTAEQHAWTLQEPESRQQPLQVISQEANVQLNSSMQPESPHVSTWGAAQTQAQQQVSSSSWHQAQLQPQQPLPSQSPPQPPWVTHQPNQNQAQLQPLTNNWAPQSQPSWTQEQAQGQRHGQPPWAQPQEQPQVTSPWAQPQEQPQSQPQVQSPWAQPQEQPQSQPQVQPPWAQPQEQPQSQPQVQPPFAQPQEQPQSQPQVQPPWAQPQEQPQSQTQVQSPWAHPQEQPQAQTQVQPPWVHSNEQQHLQQIQPSWGQSQEPMQPQSQNQWTQQSQMDSQQQPPWVQQPQNKSQVQPPWIQQGHPEPQPQPPWVQQPQHQAAQQSWSQSQAPGQPQPPWLSTQPQQQPIANAWAPPQTQAQAQPPWVHAAQPQPQVQPQTNLNPWAPVPVQAQSQPSWPQPPQEPSQHHISSWAQEQNQAQPQPPWAQSVPPQPSPQANWQQPTSNTPPQAQMNTWAPAQEQPQTPANTWTPQSQQTSVNVSMSTVNTRPSPKPWQPQQTASQNQIPPPPPRRMHSFTVDQRASSPINPMATVLNPKSSPGPAYEMPIVRGKGADMFAKRQSRMEKFVVDSETVEANKASRSTSPAASLPTEWKYTPNAVGRSYSLSPPARVPFTGQKSASASSSPKPPTQASATPQARQTSWLEKGFKPITPWEAASRHPLGLVEEAFAFQNLQQSLASNVRLAAQRKMLPELPEEWKARVSYQSQQKTGSHTWSQSQSRAPLPSFVSPTRSPVSIPVRSQPGYRSLPRQWQPQKYAAETNPRPSMSSECDKPMQKQTYKSVYTSNTWSWKR